MNFLDIAATLKLLDYARQKAAAAMLQVHAVSNLPDSGRLLCGGEIRGHLFGRNLRRARLFFFDSMLASHQRAIVPHRLAEFPPSGKVRMGVGVCYWRCEKVFDGKGRMGKPKALATRPLFPEARAILDQQFDTEYWTRTESIPRAELLARVADKEALVCLLTEKVNEELLSAAPKLRVAATVSVGYDNIDVAACTRHKVVAAHTPGVLDETTADLAWTLLMAIARRLVEGDAWMRSGTWPGWDLDQLLGGDVWGKTLGVIGFGRIGRGVARRARGFQMRVLYSDSVRVPLDVERELQAEFADLDRVLRESDFVTLHVPLLPDTRHLISTEAFGKMKPTAYLINTARGPVVDEAALVEALEHKQIAGAALDVYEQEPKVHPALARSQGRNSRAAYRQRNGGNANQDGRDGGEKCSSAF